MYVVSVQRFVSVLRIPISADQLEPASERRPKPTAAFESPHGSSDRAARSVCPNKTKEAKKKLKNLVRGWVSEREFQFGK